MRDARKRKLIRMWGLCLPSGFWSSGFWLLVPHLTFLLVSRLLQRPSSCFVCGIRVLPVSSVLSLFFFFSLSFSPISDFDFPLFFFFRSGLVFGSNSVLCWWGGSPSPSSCSLYSLASPPFSIFVFSFLVVCQISVPCSI